MKKNKLKNRENKLEQISSTSDIEEQKDASIGTESDSIIDSDAVNDTVKTDCNIELSRVSEESEEPIDEESVKEEPIDCSSAEGASSEEKKLSAKEKRKLAKKTAREKTEVVNEESNPIESAEESSTDTTLTEDGEEQNSIDDNQAEGKDASTENTAQEEDNNEASEDVDEEKEARKAEKKAKRKAWVKAHRKLISILSIVFILIVGVTVSHFVITRNVAFIHDAEDLLKFVEKEKNTRTHLIFKEDVVIDGDISIGNCNFDLNKYTLTVKGNLNISNSATANIGRQKTIWSKYQTGGKIIVEGDFTLNGLSYNILSDIEANSLLIYADEVDLKGNVKPLSLDDECNIYFKRNKSGEVIVSDYSKNNGILSISSTVDGNVHLSMESELALYGKINNIYGGAKVTLYNGSTSSMVSDCKKLYIQPYASWISFDKMTVEEYYFVEKLEKPTLLFVNDNDEQYIRISNVENADAYLLVYDDSDEIRVEKKLGDKYTEYKLPYKAPGDYKLEVYAISDNADKYLNGDSVTMTISIYSKLSTPIILGCEEIIDDEGTKTVIRIQNTPHATQYYIEINYKGIEVDVGEDDILTVDITEYIADPGISNIFVTAKATGTNYTDSDKELFSYVKTQKLVLEWLTANIIEDNKYVVAWSEPKGAQAYEISIYDENGTLVQHYITAETSITLDEKADVRIRPLGSGYYKDGDEITVQMDQAIDGDIQE